MINLKNVGKKETEFLKTAFSHNKVAHAYLFEDSIQTQALETAYWLACLFNCDGTKKPDGTCKECQQILAENNPDVFRVKLEGGKQSISIDQIRPLKEELAKSSRQGKRRFFIIENAEKMTLAANNALLNLLEEPSAPVVTILITNNANTILPTVRSRTQIIKFNDKKSNTVQAKLLEYGLTKVEIEEIGDWSNLAQEVNYLYQELMERNDLAFVRVQKLGASASKTSIQKIILYQLKQLAIDNLEKSVNLVKNARLLEKLTEVEKMRASNVSFTNSLSYLVIKFEA